MTAILGSDVTRPRTSRDRPPWHHPVAHRFAGWLAAGVMAAIVTGPQGISGEPSYSIKQALKPAHLFMWIGIMLAVGVVVELWIRGRGQIRRVAAPVRQQTTAIWARRTVRLSVYALIVLFLLIVPPNSP